MMLGRQPDDYRQLRQHESGCAAEDMHHSAEVNTKSGADGDSDNTTELQDRLYANTVPQKT